MTGENDAAPRLSDHFERGSALGLLARRHPYDFVETYEVLERAYGYTSRYVNLGLWPDGLVDDSEGLDPGARLMRYLCDRSELRSAARVLDVGSGLGQGALDLARWLAADEVVGVNLNERQIAFANALAAAAGKASSVRHLRLDACAALEASLGTGSFDAAFAVECVGHFRAPEAFFQGLHAVLRPGAPFVCCFNCAKGELPFAFRLMLQASYGFVPKTVGTFYEALVRAGFDVVEQGDLTEPVLEEGATRVLARLRDPEVRAALPRLITGLVERQLEITLDAVTRGRLGYAWILARKRPL